jgi:CheY-like chemotaxis protein
MNVLVVDDEPQFRLLMKSFLTAPGWNVTTAENGEEALEKLTETGMDLIICDVYMPMMDGIKLHRTVREIAGYEKVPFLFVSGYDDEYTLGAIKDPRCDGFYRKGRPTQELREWINYLITPEGLRPKTPPVRQASPVFQRRADRLRGE